MNLLSPAGTNLRDVKVIQVISAEYVHGEGTEASPIRIITRYLTLDGEILAEYDPCPEGTP